MRFARPRARPCRFSFPSAPRTISPGGGPGARARIFFSGAEDDPPREDSVPRPCRGVPPRATSWEAAATSTTDRGRLSRRQPVETARWSRPCARHARLQAGAGAGCSPATRACSRLLDAAVTLPSPPRCRPSPTCAGRDEIVTRIPTTAHLFAPWPSRCHDRAQDGVPAHLSGVLKAGRRSAEPRTRRTKRSPGSSPSMPTDASASSARGRAPSWWPWLKDAGTGDTSVRQGAYFA